MFLRTDELVHQGNKGDGTHLYQCPVCGGQSKLEVHRTKPVWYCHKCGTGGRITGNTRLIQAIGHDQSTARPILEGHGPERYKQLDRTRLTIWRRYLNNRGVTKDALWSILRPYTGPEPLRVYFPLYELGGYAPVSFVGRAIIPSKIPYRYPAKDTGWVSPKSLLWGTHRLRCSPKSLMLCEGIFDAVWYPNAVATLGKNITKDQIDLMKRINPDTIEIFFDRDAIRHAFCEAVRIANSLMCKITVIHLTSHKDPDDFARSGRSVRELHRTRVA